MACVFLAVCFGAGLRLLATRLTAVAFLAGLGFGVALRAAFETAVFETVARFAFGFEADLALTARLADFEDVPFAAVRAVDRRKPFERLLLILGLISKGCSGSLSSRRNGAQLSIRSRLNQSAQLFAGTFRYRTATLINPKSINKEKLLMVIVCYVTLRLA